MNICDFSVVFFAWRDSCRDSIFLLNMFSNILTVQIKLDWPRGHKKKTWNSWYSWLSCNSRDKWKNCFIWKSEFLNHNPPYHTLPTGGLSLWVVTFVDCLIVCSIKKKNLPICSTGHKRWVSGVKNGAKSLCGPPLCQPLMKEKAKNEYI